MLFFFCMKQVSLLAVFLIAEPYGSDCQCLSPSPPTDNIQAMMFGGKRGDYQNYSVSYCVLKLCTVISTLRRAVLTVRWIGFCHTGPISLCIDSLVFISVYFCFILHMCCFTVSTVGCTRWY